MVLSLFSAIELGAMHANASSADSDGDGMPLGLEYILGLSDSDWDFDGDECLMDMNGPLGWTRLIKIIHKLMIRMVTAFQTG